MEIRQRIAVILCLGIGLASSGLTVAQSLSRGVPYRDSTVSLLQKMFEVLLPLFQQGSRFMAQSNTWPGRYGFDHVLRPPFLEVADPIAAIAPTKCVSRVE